MDYVIDKESGDPLAGLCKELEEISGKSRLEFIKIVIDLTADHTDGICGKLERVLPQPGWPLLSVCLCA
jgi:hypothetical protein